MNSPMIMYSDPAFSKDQKRQLQTSVSLDGDHLEASVAVGGVGHKLHGDVSSGGHIGEVGTLPAAVPTNQGPVLVTPIVQVQIVTMTDSHH